MAYFRDCEIYEIAYDIVEKFEELLDRKDIEIPCSDEEEQQERHWGDNDAKLYGMEYYDLIDEIEDILRERVE